MRGFRRDGEVITTTLDGDEVELLDSLASQLIAMLSDLDEDDGSGTADGTASGTAAGDDLESDSIEGAGTAGGAESGGDPFAFWARDLAADPDEPELPDDPAVARLFPNAYPHDPQAASEFRRFTQADLQQGKIDSARTVRATLAATDGGRVPLRISVDQVDTWLKFLTNLRLVFAARLGIDDAEGAERIASLPPEDPRAFMASVYEWLGFAQETLVEAL